MFNDAIYNMLTEKTPAQKQREDLAKAESKANEDKIKRLKDKDEKEREEENKKSELIRKIINDEERHLNNLEKLHKLRNIPYHRTTYDKEKSEKYYQKLSFDDLKKIDTETRKKNTLMQRDYYNEALHSGRPFENREIFDRDMQRNQAEAERLGLPAYEPWRRTDPVAYTGKRSVDYLRGEIGKLSQEIEKGRKNKRDRFDQPRSYLEMAEEDEKLDASESELIKLENELNNKPISEYPLNQRDIDRNTLRKVSNDLDRYLPSKKGRPDFGAQAKKLIDKFEQEKGRKKNITLESLEDERKEIARRAFETYERPYHLYPHDPVAELTENQIEARRLLAEADPNTLQNQKKISDLRNAIHPHLGNKTSQEAVGKYLEDIKKNPADMHEQLFGDVERKWEDSIKNKAEADFNERILPKIRGAYQMPGYFRSGHQAYDTNRALVKYGEGIAHALAQNRVNLRAKGIDAAQRHAGILTNAADIHQRSAEKDQSHNLAAVATLRQLNKEEQAAQLGHIGALESAGREDQRANQERINQDKNQFNILNQQPWTSLGSLNSIINKQPLNAAMIPTLPPSTNAGATETGMAQYLSGLAQSAWAGGQNQYQGYNQNQNQNQRAAYAEGGRIEPAQEAINNSIQFQTDPINELRRLMNLPQPRNYAIGGRIDPIEQGAQEAKSYAGDEALRSSMQQRINGLNYVPERNFGHMMMDAFGAVDPRNQSWIGHAARGINSVREKQEQRDYYHQARQDQAAQLQYELEREIERKKALRRKELREERILDMKSKYYDSLIAKNGSKQSMISNVDPGDLPTKIQTEKDIKAIEEAKERLTDKNDAISRLYEAEESLSNVPTGRGVFYANKLTAGIANPLIDLIGGSKKGYTLSNAIDDEEAALTAVKKALPMKGRSTNAMLFQEQRSKLHHGSNTSSIKKNALLTRSKLYNSALDDIRSIQSRGASQNDVKGLLKSFGFSEDDLKTYYRAKRVPSLGAQAPNANEKTLFDQNDSRNDLLERVRAAKARKLAQVG